MELEIKVMWCKGLTVFNFFQKLTVYAAVSITSEDERIQLDQNQKQEQKTPIDENGEGDPEWNYHMKFDLCPLQRINPNMNYLSLLFELRCPGQIFGEKSIGEVRVPLQDLIQSVGSEVVRFVKYEVRNPEGKHNGILDFSYKLINPNHDVQINDYDHIHNQQFLVQNHQQHCINSDNHMIGYQSYHNHNLNLSNESFSTLYPRIDLDEPLVYPPPSSFTSMIDTNYHDSATLYPPPSSQSWVSPSHYPPQPQQQPYVYPPPQPQPYGDPHWGYRRADSSYHN